MESVAGARGASLFCSDLCINPLIPSCLSLMFRRTNDRHRRHLSTTQVRRSNRSCIYLEEGEHLVVGNTHVMSCTILKAFKSSGPQEVCLSNEQRTNQLLSGCGNNEECVLGGIVALGKFDALHIGHRELAIQASKAGTPFLLSFVGIAEVLGWETRPPIVAPCDRKRVLSSWARYCGAIVPVEYEVEFSKVRHLSPRHFVEKLSKELRIRGVVAGENYRFGYKASGDASELVRLCKEYGLEACIVSPVMDTSHPLRNGAPVIGPGEWGQVSSTRVRHALASRDMEYVSELLGRKHRLVLAADGPHCIVSNSGGGRVISAHISCLINQPPGDGVFETCNLLFGDGVFGPCRVVIGADTVDIELGGGDDDNGGRVVEMPLGEGRMIGIEFG